jgi:hypothetical protein
MPVSMSDAELETARRRGFTVAYRMLRSVSEAEDVARSGFPDAPERIAPLTFGSLRRSRYTSATPFPPGISRKSDVPRGHGKTCEAIPRHDVFPPCSQ